VFRSSEKLDLKKRGKFLRQIERSCELLLNVYTDETFMPGSEEFNLPQHPSHGMKELANTVYNLFELHWRCKCTQRAELPTGAKEARLSLMRHRQLVRRIQSHAHTSQRPSPAKFEVLLPVCKESEEWKVTTVDVKNYS
jgi:hypothetical protein